MAKRRRVTRAERRRAEREAANRAARERAVEAAAEAEDANRPRYARHVGELDRLARNGIISEDQARAGHRFARDFQLSATTSARLIGRYLDLGMPQRPGKAIAPPDTPGTLAARERFEHAVQALGPLTAIVVHTAICDLSPRDSVNWRTRGTG
jgi:hypothetical protein